jgi:hypothetical protein
MKVPFPMKALHEAREEFERALGIRKGFIGDLAHEDDWSFVIKSHALFEGALTHLLTTTLDRNELKEVFAQGS